MCRRVLLKINQNYILISFLIVFLGMFFISCSATAKAVIGESGEKGELNVSIRFEDFFIQYLKDFIGFTVFSDIIDTSQLKAFFEHKPGITRVYVSVSNDPEIIRIYFSFTNIYELFKGFNIPFKRGMVEGEKEIVKMNIDKEFIKTVIADMPTFREIGPDALFVFDGEAVPKEQFAEYVGWAMSDYKTKKIIQRSVENSEVGIILKKKGEVIIIPDEGWKKLEENEQERKMPLVDFLYEDDYNVSYTY